MKPLTFDVFKLDRIDGIFKIFQETKYEFSWPLGDVLTNLAQAGLRLERLEEYPGKAGWRFGNQPEQAARLPGEYVLLARKD
jgi:hypothetical protein